MKLTSIVSTGIACAIALPSAALAQAVPDIVIDTDSPGGPTAPAPTPPPAPTASGEPHFFCQLDGSRYTVMYRPEGQAVAYPWAVPGQLGSGWTPERRCQEISARLERYRPDGLLELRTAFEGNYETVCATTQNDPSCRIVFTVPPGQDATATLDRVFENLVLAGNGQQTIGVNTYAGGGGALGRDLGRLFGMGSSNWGSAVGSRGRIDVLPYLDRADGGTGARLQALPATVGTSESVVVPSAGRRRRLNPELFR